MNSTISETTGSDVFICADLGCAYRWNGVLQVLEWAPLASVPIEDEDWGVVEEIMVGEESVTVDGMDRSVSDVLRQAELALGVRRSR